MFQQCVKLGGPQRKRLGSGQRPKREVGQCLLRKRLTVPFGSGYAFCMIRMPQMFNARGRRALVGQEVPFGTFLAETFMRPVHRKSRRSMGEQEKAWLRKL